MKTPAMQVTLISASAGSGKTWKLTEELSRRLEAGDVEPERVIAVTFTRAAAAELKSRVRGKLFEKGAADAAHRIEAALVGTVHSVCEVLLQRFAFEAGISPNTKVVPEEDAETFFNEAMAEALTPEIADRLAPIAERFETEDYLGIVQDIADLARVNAISADQLQAMARDSVDGFLRHFPRPEWAAPRKADAELSSALSAAISGIKNNIESGIDATGGTAKYLEQLERTAAALAHGRLSWSRRGSLQKDAPCKNSEALARPVMDLGARQFGHPLLREDVTTWIELIFTLAATALGSYQAWKSERSLIDFIDMEEKLLRLLDQVPVLTTLADEFDLLLIDEFQDTSPIQLALFNRLGRATGNVVWVGDKKQSIFGFRGCDPALMDAAYEAVSSRTTPEYLTKSYRSRPELVEFCSAVFKSTFVPLGYAEEGVVLEPAREPARGLPPVLECWLVDGKNKEADTGAIAAGARELLDENPPVLIEDPVTGEARPIRPGDIAILRRMNEDCAKTVRALAAAGIRATVSQKNLAGTPEGTFLLAATEVVLDSRASLPAFTLIYLREGKGEEAIIDERIRTVRDDIERGDRFRTPWEDDALLVRLRALRAETATLCPREMLDRIIETSAVRDLCVRWGRADQRLGNIEMFRALAAKYEETCRLHQSGASLLGLLLHFNSLDDGGDQSARFSEDAVTVSTYHKAKGKEWPIVVLGDLDKSERKGCACNGARMLMGRGPFDFDNPLKGRHIRYWPWPYGAQSTGAPLHPVLAATAAEREARDRVDREDQRLMYVGFTRARDILVLPTRKGKPRPRLLELIHPSLALPADASPGKTKLPVGGKHSLAVRVRVPAVDPAPVSQEPVEPTWFRKPDAPPPDRAPLYVAPSAIEDPVGATVGATSLATVGTAGAATVEAASLATVEAASAATVGAAGVATVGTAGAATVGATGATVGASVHASVRATRGVTLGATHELGPRLEFRHAMGPDDPALGNALHAYLAADPTGRPEGEQQALAASLLEAHGVADTPENRTLLATAALRLDAHLKARWPGARIHRELPLQLRRESQIIQGVADLVVETPEAVHLIDHKSFPGPREACQERALIHAPQIFAYADALETALGLSCRTLAIHFPVHGIIVEIHRSPSPPVR